MSRLPVPGSDNGVWGDLLNDFLVQAHNADGTLLTNSVGAAQIKSNSVTAAAIVDGTVTGAKLDPTTQSALTMASASVQSVNGKTPVSGVVTLAPADVSAEPVGLSSATQMTLSRTYGTVNPAIYYLDIYRDLITGPWVTGQLNTPTTLTSSATVGTNTINVASGANYPTGSILSVYGGTADQQQYKITAGGGTNSLTVTPNIVKTLLNGSSINTLWGDTAHLQDWAALAYFLMNAKRTDGTPVIQDPGTKPIVLLGNSWYVAGGTAITAAITAKYPSATVINKGVNGNTSNQVLARYDTDVASNAAYVIIDEPGVNDAAHGALTWRDNSISNLTALVAKCRAIGAIPVFIGPPPLAQQPNTSLQNSIWLRAVLASPTFPDVPLTAIPQVQAPSAIPEPSSINIGPQAGDRTTTATQNIAIGTTALLNNQTSSGNVAIGVNVLPSLLSGNGANVAVGTVAMYAATTIQRSVAIGQGALYNPGGVGANASVTSANNVAVGYQAGASDATDPSSITAVGSSARAAGQGTAIGYSAVASATNSTAIGAQTSATGNGSVALGRDNLSVSASTSVINEIKLGTSSHTTKIVGRLNVAPRTPTSGSDSQGAVGDITSDDSYVYAKTSIGWKRAALTSW